MPTGYPGALDTYPNPTSTTLMDDASFPHAQGTSNLGDGLEAVQATLGINPQGGQATVKARLDAVDTAVTARLLASQKAAASGVASLDASSMLVQNVDASKVTSGLLAAARIPDLDAAKIISGTLAVARIPSLPASQIGSGTLAVARIPALPASIITSGTIDAARLPSTVTSNANATVVADIAARDAIPLVNRTDGMLVYVKAPVSWWCWRADNSTWQCISLRLKLTAAQSTLTTGAMSSVTGFSFPVMAGVSYAFDVDTIQDNVASALADIRFGFSSPAGTLHAGFIGPDPATAAGTSVGNINSFGVTGSTAATYDNTGAAFATTNVVATFGLIRAMFECTTSGTVQMRFGQGTTNANASRLLPGTRMRVESV